MDRLEPHHLEKGVKIVPARYTFRQLLKWKISLRALFASPELGVTMLDIDETKNLITLGLKVVNPRAVALIEQTLTRLGIPREAVEIVQRGPLSWMGMIKLGDPYTAGLRSIMASSYLLAAAV